MPKTKYRFEIERSIFLEHIKQAGLRKTSQRDLIMETFLSTEEHLTIEDLHRLVQRRDPTIGHTTVYRTLKLLTEAGLAREVRFGDNKTYFEHHHDHGHHDHMICTACGRVLEFFSEAIENLQDEMAKEFGFLPTHHSLRMWGLCRECQHTAESSVSVPSGAQPRVRVKTAIDS
ncbi:MAG: transcriptional repressor [Pyrinomonadaceae bacterium]|nr:transcriptional repressor [Pyrinomonadaceae bacterium]